MVAKTIEIQRAALGGDSSPSDTEAMRFLAQRVALYAKLMAVVFGVLYVGGAVITLVAAPDVFAEFHRHPAKLANLALAFLAIAVWLLLRRPNLPRVLVVASDFLLPISITLAAAVSSTARVGALGFEVIFLLLLLLVLSLVFRAALVPSPPARTALIGALASLPIIFASYGVAMRDPTLPGFSSPLVAPVAALGWGFLITLATSAVSREIYGLQREVRNARRLGQYTLLSLLGEGGMGAVYRAQHALLRRPTAVKLLLPERAGPENIARFEREVQLTSMLTHPNTVAVYDYGRTPDNVFYYAMEYIDGLSLDQLVEQYGAQPAGRVINILLQASSALAEAHSVGIIHRDIKPANILLCERGGLPDVVKLVDFGLVKEINPGGDSAPALTHTNALTGTPLYLAPESLTTPESVDCRVDLYALGAVGYLLLTGVNVFTGKSIVEVCSHHLHSEPVAPSKRLGKPIPEQLEKVIMRCLSKSPADRPASAVELHDALAECARSENWSVSDAHEWWAARHVAQRRGVETVDREALALARTTPLNGAES